MGNLKHDTDELIYEAETDSQTLKTDLWFPSHLGYKLLYIEWMDNKSYCVAQGTTFNVSG